MLLTPTDIETAARNIAEFWTTSELLPPDKIKILKMVVDYYTSLDNHQHERYLGQLAQRMLDKYDPPTGFEKNDRKQFIQE